MLSWRSPRTFKHFRYESAPERKIKRCRSAAVPWTRNARNRRGTGECTRPPRPGTSKKPVILGGPGQFTRGELMKTFVKTALLLTLAAATVRAQINAGEIKPEPGLPFTMTPVATFKLPWRIAFLPDGRMLITEKVGPIWLVTQKGEKTPVANVPEVLYQGQGGMLGVFISPHYATDQSVYLTYSEPGDGG